MVFRNDYGDAGEKRLEGTHLGVAFSDDGLHWTVRDDGPCFVMETDEIRRAYDPRLTVIDGRCYMCFAVDKDPDRVLKGWEGSGWKKRYTVGLMLLDLENPAKVIGLCPEARYPYEVDGFRGSVLFPTGMILEPDGQVKIYYGASDTVMALATAHVDELVALCEPI